MVFLSAVTAHPRSRGENPFGGVGEVDCKGSSPLTRGKPRRNRLGGPIRGLIPAHAGKTFWRGLEVRDPEAHPRSRGENVVERAIVEALGGSSPLTRGKRWLVLGCSAHHRLIPAHAGKTRTLPSPAASPTAHPRSRGENLGAERGHVGFNGSSPLTRGKPRGTSLRGLQCGLIPAHAGKTAYAGAGVSGSMAHPRSRGEN